VKTLNIDMAPRRKKKTNSMEFAEPPTSSRPSRNRKAPERFTSSACPTNTRNPNRRARYQPAVKTRSASKKKDVATLIEERDREENFIKNYTYSHVGQADREKSPDIWIEVPAVALIWVSMKKKGGRIECQVGAERHLDRI
jgi:hypothetical protein